MACAHAFVHVQITFMTLLSVRLYIGVLYNTHANKKKTMAQHRVVQAIYSLLCFKNIVKLSGRQVDPARAQTLESSLALFLFSDEKKERDAN